MYCTLDPTDYEYVAFELILRSKRDSFLVKGLEKVTLSRGGRQGTVRYSDLDGQLFTHSSWVFYCLLAASTSAPTGSFCIYMLVPPDHLSKLLSMFAT